MVRLFRKFEIPLDRNWKPSLPIRWTKAENINLKYPKQSWITNRRMDFRVGKRIYGKQYSNKSRWKNYSNKRAQQAARYFVFVVLHRKQLGRSSTGASGWGKQQNKWQVKKSLHYFTHIGQEKRVDLDTGVIHVIRVIISTRIGGQF